MNAIALDMLIVIAAAITHMAGWLIVSQYLLWALAIIVALQLLSVLIPLLFAAVLWMVGACASLYSKIVNRQL